MNLTFKCCLDFNLKHLLDYTNSWPSIFSLFFELYFWIMRSHKYSVRISTCQDAFYDVFWLIQPSQIHGTFACFLKLSLTLMYLIQTICWRGLKGFDSINRHSWPAVCDLIACHDCHILLYSSVLPKPYLCWLIICPQMPNHIPMNNLQKWSLSFFP